MRILLVSDSYPPLIGGAERQTQLIGRKLTERGHQVGVVTMWQSGLPVREDDRGLAVRRLKALAARVPWFSGDAGRRHHPPFPDPSIVLGIRQLVNDFQPDLVHVYGWITYSCAAALIGNRVPLLVSARDYGYSCPTRCLLHAGRACHGPRLWKCLGCARQQYGSLKGLAATVGVLGGRGLLLRRMNGLHTISRFVHQVMERDLLCGSMGRIPCTTISSFRDSTEEGSADPAFLERLPQEPFILFVGALQPIKGVVALLDAYCQLEAPPRLVLIGAVWPDTPQDIPAEVVVLRSIPHADVMAAWERCLFAVAPSVWPEPFGSVVHEAMSTGRAVIGTFPGGHSDMIVDGETGLLVPAGDAVALAQAMQCLIADEAMRMRMGRAARERARLFTAEQVIPQFEQLYRQMIGRYYHCLALPEPEGIVECVE